DPRTLVIQWRAPYPDAGRIQMEDFDPVPRHILDQAFAAVAQDPTSADAFLGHPYWMPEYIGAGPYRLVRWEPGSLVEGSELERRQLILTNFCRQAGSEVTLSVLPSFQVRDGQPRHTFPGIATRGGALTERAWLSAEVGTAENRWTGDNRSGWASAEYDR